MNQPAKTPTTVSFGSEGYLQLLEELREDPHGIVLVYGATPQEQLERVSSLAGELALDLYRIDLSAIISKYIGNTERAISRRLTEDGGQGSTLFLAEADALYGKRVEVDGCFLRYRDTESSRLFQLGASRPGIVFTGSATLPDEPGPWERWLRAIVGPPSP